MKVQYAVELLCDDNRLVGFVPERWSDCLQNGRSVSHRNDGLNYPTKKYDLIPNLCVYIPLHKDKCQPIQLLILFDNAGIKDVVCFHCIKMQPDTFCVSKT